ncbi:MAG: SIMPL domain-containing protein [Vampirovibrionales bacterium]|nr:SIMPL domain-containing protein [Vampirovibrionales bacterium]
MLLSRRFAMPVCFYLGLGLMALTVALSPLAANAEVSYENTLNTNGHAEVEAPNDSIRFSAGMENEAKTLSEARQANALAMTNLRQAMNALMVKGLKLKTTGFNSYPLWPNDGKARPKKPVGYHVSNTFSVTVEGATTEQLADYGSKLVDSAITAGASNVGSLSFYLNDIRTHQLKALEKAVQNAKEQADIMAKAAGSMLVGVYQIEGTPQMNYAKQAYPMAMMRSAMGGADMAEASTPIEAGDQTISADVSVRFKLMGFVSPVAVTK